HIGARVQVSVDGGNEQTHDAFRGKGSFEQAIRATSILRSTGIPVSWSTTLWSRAAKEIEEVAAMAQKLGVFRCTFRQLFPVGRAAQGYSQLLLEPSAWDEAKSKLKDCQTSYGSSPTIEFETIMDQVMGIQKHPNPSPAGVQHCVITPEGYLLPCQYLRGQEFIIGNLMTDSFIDVWKTSSVLARFRNPSAACTCKDCMSNCSS